MFAANSISTNPRFTNMNPTEENVEMATTFVREVTMERFMTYADICQIALTYQMHKHTYGQVNIQQRENYTEIGANCRYLDQNIDPRRYQHIVPTVARNEKLLQVACFTRNQFCQIVLIMLGLVAVDARGLLILRLDYTVKKCTRCELINLSLNLMRCPCCRERHMEQTPFYTAMSYSP